MANEFVARLGLIARQDSQITGSLKVTGSLQITGSVTSAQFGFTGSLLGTASYVSGNVYTSANPALSASYALRADSVDGYDITALVTTGSQGVTQIISGSLLIQQNITVLGTSSIQNITASQLNISTNIISVNTQNPSFRFGGLAAIDSGSNPPQSGSILYDSVEDEWIFVHRGGSATVTSSHFMMGPESYGGVGNETYIPGGRLIRSVGTEHMTGSNLYDDGTAVQITGSVILISGSSTSVIITGSVNSTGGFTGSLFGTASYALTASFLLGGGTGLKTKSSGSLASNFAGNPKISAITFTTAFTDNNYSVVITGEDARTWTIESKTSAGFTINSNSNVSPTGITYWTATAFGES